VLVRHTTAQGGAARGLHRGVTRSSLVVLVLGIGATDWLVTQPFSRPVEFLLKASVAMAFLTYARIVLGLSMSEMGMARRDARRGMLVGAIAGGGILAAIAVLVIVPATRGHFTSSRVMTDASSLHWLEPLLFIPFGTVLFEELIFRGVLLGAMLRRWDARWSVLATSILFALWHLPGVIHTSGSSLHVAGAVAGTVVVTTVAGVLFGILRLRSASLVAPILAHLALDAGAYVLALAALRLWG
jgi:uncharacterized protein